VKVAEIQLLHNWLSWQEPTKPKISHKDMRLAPQRLRLAALNKAKISLSYGSLANRVAQLRKCRNEFRLAYGSLA